MSLKFFVWYHDAEDSMSLVTIVEDAAEAQRRKRELEAGGAVVTIEAKSV